MITDNAVRKPYFDAGLNAFVGLEKEKQMEAKDTVMSDEQIINYTIPPRSPLTEYIRLLEAQAEITWKARGTEIGEAICCLVGNTMLEDMEKGKELGEQLRPIIDLCKQ